jgi:hypothetical protein
MNTQSYKLFNTHGQPVLSPVAPSPTGIAEWTTMVKCGRCGGCGRYSYHGACYDCGGLGKVPRKFKGYTAEALAKRVKRQTAKRAARNEALAVAAVARDAKLVALIGLSYFQFLDCVAATNPDSFAVNIALKADGELSEKQTKVLTDWMDRFQKFADYVAPPVVELEVGKRIEVVAKLVFIKMVESQFGSTLKGLFVVNRDGSESKIWMTVPSAIDCSESTKDVEFHIAVTLEKSNDEGFYFGKRPTIVKK